MLRSVQNLHVTRQRHVPGSVPNRAAVADAQRRVVGTWARPGRAGKKLPQAGWPASAQTHSALRRVTGVRTAA
jgi:hypothetical protein